MPCLRPATPGFLVTLVATGLLAVVVFCVPYLKSVYFLKATVTVQNITGNITFGTLGYCVELPGNTTCSSPSIGYQLDINGLVGNNLPIQIPEVIVKWITYALFLHVIALIGAAASAVFGLLAHVREMSMACCSTCFSGFAAAIAMVAFIFDLVLFFVAKARINAIGYASIGTAIWLTLAAWILLFFSGCFYTLGRCCIRGRPSGGSGYLPGWMGGRDKESGPDKVYAEQMRLDAVKAEADRKARQKQGEVGLPAFHETQPLTGHVDGNHVYLESERSEPDPEAQPPATQQAFKGGYVPRPTGTRTMDEYYNTPPSGPNSYPPQVQQGPRRQRSDHSNYSPSISNYVPSTSNYAPGVSQTPPMPAVASGYAAATGYAQYNPPTNLSPPSSNQLLAAPGQYSADPYGREYGHTAGGTSYHTAISHDHGPSTYNPYDANDPYSAQAHYQQTSQYTQHQQVYNSESYNNTGLVTHSPPPMPQGAAAGYYPSSSTSPPPIHQPQPHHGPRSYTLGGDGYGSNQLPPLPEHYIDTTIPEGHISPPLPQPQGSFLGYTAPTPIDTSVSGYPGQPSQTSPVKGPRPQPGEAPPGYESSVTGVSGNWGKR